MFKSCVEKTKSGCEPCKENLVAMPKDDGTFECKKSSGMYITRPRRCPSKQK